MMRAPETLRLTSGSYASSPGSGPFGAFLIADGSDSIRMIASGADELIPWEHVSVSLQFRCPRWDEMCLVKGLFWEPEDTVIQFHPAASRYVNEHKFCLHLWRPVGVTIPEPPLIAISDKPPGKQP